MVERLKRAIEKAREERGLRTPDAFRATADRPGVPTKDALTLPVVAQIDWRSIPEARLDPKMLHEARIAGLAGQPELMKVFDSLQTRLLRLTEQNDWTRIALTAPTSGCGTTTFALNLAFALARTTGVRVLLVDMHLARPMIGRRLGLSSGRNLSSGRPADPVSTEALRRLGENLVIAARPTPIEHEASIRPDLFFAKLLDRLGQTWRPDIVVLDLPPLLESEDAHVLLPLADAALLIASAERTTAPEIEESARLITASTSYLGTALNKSKDRTARRALREPA